MCRSSFGLLVSTNDHAITYSQRTKKGFRPEETNSRRRAQAAGVLSESATNPHPVFCVDGLAHFVGAARSRFATAYCFCVTRMISCSIHSGDPPSIPVPP